MVFLGQENSVCSRCRHQSADLIWLGVVWPRSAGGWFLPPVVAVCLPPLLSVTCRGACHWYLNPWGARGEHIWRRWSYLKNFFGRKGGGVVSYKDPNSTKAHGWRRRRGGGGLPVTAGMRGKGNVPFFHEGMQLSWGALSQQMCSSEPPELPQDVRVLLIVLVKYGKMLEQDHSCTT